MNSFLILFNLLISLVFSEDKLCSFKGGELNQSSLQQIENEGCNIINGSDVDINIGVGIESLENLRNINKIIGTFHMHGSNLVSLNGLNNLEAVIGLLHVSMNSRMESLDALHNLTSVVELTLHQLPKIVSLSGLAKLKTIEYLTIGYCNSLESLDGLDKIQNLHRLSITRNDALNSLQGLHNVIAVTEYFKISNNAVLNSLQGLHNIMTIVRTANSFSMSYNGLNCSNNCNLNEIIRLERIANQTVTQCDVEKQTFSCPTMIFPLECAYDTKCHLCDPFGCTFKTIFRHCGDDVLDGGNEECDNSTNPQCNSSCKIEAVPSTESSSGVFEPSSTVSDMISSSTVASTESNSGVSEPSSTTIELSSDSSDISVLDTPSSIVDTSSSIVDKSNSATNTKFTSQVTESSVSKYSGGGETINYGPGITKDISSLCEANSCVMQEENGFTVYQFDTINVTENLFVSNYQQLSILEGNFALNGFNLTLSAESKVNIDGCLDARNSELIVNLNGMEPFESKEVLELIEYACLTSEFSDISVINGPEDTCGNPDATYSKTRVLIEIKLSQYCVSESFKLLVPLYQHFSLILLFFSTSIFF